MEEGWSRQSTLLKGQAISGKGPCPPPSSIQGQKPGKDWPSSQRKVDDCLDGGEECRISPV